MEFSTDVKIAFLNHGFLQHACQEDHSTSYYLPLDPGWLVKLSPHHPNLTSFWGGFCNKSCRAKHLQYWSCLAKQATKQCYAWHFLAPRRREEDSKKRRSHLVPTKIAICWVPMQYPQSPWGAKQRLKSMGGPIADKLNHSCWCLLWVNLMTNQDVFLTYLPQKSKTNHKHKRKPEQPWTTNVFVMVRFCWGQHTNPKWMVKCMLDPWNPLNKPES